MQYLKTLLCLSSTVILASACTPQISQKTKITPAPDTAVVAELSEEAIFRIQKNPKTAKKSILRVFDKLALNGSVSLDKIQIETNARTTQSRAAILQQLIILDKNGDSQISAKEMLESNDSQVALWRRNRTNYMPYSEADLNDDNTITLNESFLFAQKYAPTMQRSHQTYETLLGAFDTNKDGNITRAEIINELDNIDAIKKEAKKASSTSSNPKLRNSMNRAESKKRLEKSAPTACQPSSLPSKKADVIFLSGYEGSGLSSVAVTGLDHTTEVARLIIEKGSQPLYIMLSSHTPLIWSIEGDTKRVEKLIIGRNRNKQGAGAGVIGISQNKVEFLGRGCLSNFYKTNDSKKIMARTQWGKLIGQAPNNIFGAYTLNSMKLPSGINTSKKDTKKANNRKSSNKKPQVIIKNGRTIIMGGDGDDKITVGKNNTVSVVTQDKKENDFGLYRYNIEGLIEVNAKDVIAPEPVQSYDVLPQEAGLMQLVKAGKLEALERGSFGIVKPIARFPAGLSGGHSVKFILGPGVTLPKGDPGHSSVLSEESGECLTRRCR